MDFQSEKLISLLNDNLKNFENKWDPLKAVYATDEAATTIVQI